jgi:hypothetical protein
MQIRPRRSVLYMPGSNARALEKAKSIPADALILDLEDAVAPEAKETARVQVCAAVKAGGYGHRELIIRVNALDTPWGKADIEAAAAAAPDAILLPKPGTGADIVRATEALAHAGAPDKTRLWAMIETPLAILNVADIASASQRQGCAARLLRPWVERPRQGDARRSFDQPASLLSTGCPPRSQRHEPTASTRSTASTTTSGMQRATSASACTAAASASTARR